MRVLVLGGSGMLGHRLCRVLSARVETWATFRKDAEERGARILTVDRLVGLGRGGGGGGRSLGKGSEALRGDQVEVGGHPQDDHGHGGGGGRRGGGGGRIRSGATRTAGTGRDQPGTQHDQNAGNM